MSSAVIGSLRLLLNKVPVALSIASIPSLLTSLSPSYCHCKGSEPELLKVSLAVEIWVSSNYSQSQCSEPNTSEAAPVREGSWEDRSQQVPHLLHVWS